MVHFFFFENWRFKGPVIFMEGFLGGSDGKESSWNAGDPGSVPGSGRSPGEGNGNLLWNSCLENPMDRGAWWATVHGVAKSQTRLSLRLYSRKTGWKNAVGVKCQSTASFSFPPLNGVNPFRHWMLKNKPGKLQLGLPEREAGSPWLWVGQVGRGRWNELGNWGWLFYTLVVVVV